MNINSINLNNARVLNNSENTKLLAGIKNNLAPLSTDVVSFRGKNENEIKISNLKNQTARDFFNELNAKSPEKCQILLNNEDFTKSCNLDFGLFCDKYTEMHKKPLEAFKEAVDKIDPKDLKDIVNSISKRQLRGSTPFFNGIILCANDKKAFDYVIQSPVVDEKQISTCYSKDLCKYILSVMKIEAVCTLDYNSVIEIEKGNNDNYNYSEYTSDSNNFIEDSEQSQELHNQLAKCISEGDVTAYRGEKSSWMFDSVPIDKNMENKIRRMVLLNRQSRKDLVYPNKRYYDSQCKQSIYDHIKNKKSLTLADAMLVAKYGNQKFVNEVIDKINNSSVEDSNFKSYTLSREFAQRWAHHKNGSCNNNMLAIETKTNIKKGNQAAYYAKSGQYEFIVNNNPKIMTFSNARFDKEKNTFIMDSEITAK